MSDIHGRFIWYELATPTVPSAKAFYGDVVGWTAQDMPMPDGTYTILQMDGEGVAGVTPFPPFSGEMEPLSTWTGYVAVDDVDATAIKARDIGGALMRPPQDIPGIGRFAVIADPDGASIAVMTPLPQDPPRPQPPAGAVGHVGWRELMAADLDGAFAFYETLFGWRKDGEMDMGPAGVYQLFANQDGQVGGMMIKPEAFPAAPAWLYYFRVPDIDAAAGRAKAGGGFVMNGPNEVPGDDWVIQGMDPQLATFCLVGKKA